MVSYEVTALIFLNMLQSKIENKCIFCVVYSKQRSGCTLAQILSYIQGEPVA